LEIKMSDLLSFEAPGNIERGLADIISPIEEIIEEARNGRMFVLVDHKIEKMRVIWLFPLKWQRLKLSILWRVMGED